MRAGSFIAGMVVAIAAGGAPSALAQAPAAPPSVPTPLVGNVTDGPVSALARAGDTIYLGGGFTRIGPRTGGLVNLDRTAGTRAGTIPPVTGTVFAIVPDGAGGAYIAGKFTAVGRVPRTNIAHVLADGTVDPGFAPGPDADVLSLLLHEGRLYIGGEFLKVGDVIRRRIAALDPVGGAVVDGFNPGADAAVQDMAVAGRRLFVDGRFTGLGGKSRNGMAVLDAISGAVEGTFDPQVNGNVDAVAVIGRRVYFGGNFTQVSGRSRSRLVAFDTETLEIDPEFSPSTNGPVYGLATDGARLFVAGNFTEIARAFNNGVASLDPATGEASQAFRLFFNGGDAYTLAVAHGKLYVGGEFTKANEIPRNHLAAVDPVTGTVDATFDPDADDDVYAVAALASGTILAGGKFTSAPRTPALRIAAISARTGLTVPGFSAGTDGAVSDLAMGDGRLFAGGEFKAANGVPRQKLAAFDAATGALDALDVAVGSRKPRGTTGQVAALATSPGRLYVGGQFSEIGGQQHPSLAAVDLGSGRVLAGFNRPAVAKTGRRGISGFVAAITPVRDRVYIGGNLGVLRRAKRPKGSRAKPTLTGTNQPLIALARTDGARVGSFRPRIDGTIADLAAGNNRVFAAGLLRRFVTTTFKRVKGKRVAIKRFRRNLVALDARGRIDRGFLPKSPNGEVRAISLDGAKLYLLGNFGKVAGRLRVGGLAAVNARTGRLSSAFAPQLFAAVPSPTQSVPPGTTPSVPPSTPPPTVPAGPATANAIQAGGGVVTVGGNFAGFGTTTLPFVVRFPAAP